MLAVASFLLSASLLGASPPAAQDRVGPEAIFKPAPGFLEAFHAACDGKSGDAFAECFAAQMKKAGASAAARAFTRRIGNQGYLSALRESGRVDVAQVEFPFRANENQAWFLVNGEPPLIDVSEVPPLSSLLEASSVYRNLRVQNPKIAAFFRGSAEGPRTRRRAEGGQSFVVVFDLRDGCRACENVAYAPVAFDFDTAGRFVGRTLGQVKPFYH